MSEPKLTPWFVNGEKPVRKGVYERRCGYIGRYSYWDGRHWCLGGNEILGVADSYSRSKPSKTQGAPWRGLAHPPKAKP